MILRAGDLTRSLGLLAPTNTTSSVDGSTSVSYALSSTIRAKIDEKWSNKIYEDDQKKQQDDAVFIARYKAASILTVHYHLTYEGKTYGISEVSEAPEYGRHKAMRIRCYSKT